jgi:prevent-host-death family protein
MKQFNIHEATAQLSKLVDLANKGESFVIAKAGTPLAKLVPFSEPAPKKKIKYGLMKDKVCSPTISTLRYPRRFLLHSKAANRTWGVPQTIEDYCR